MKKTGQKNPISPKVKVEAKPLPSLAERKKGKKLQKEPEKANTPEKNKSISQFLRATPSHTSSKEI